MARTKKTETDIFAELAEDTGGKVLSDSKPVKYYVDTGNLAVNFMCCGKFMGGGIASGHITEILGPSSGGKSLWGTNIIRGAQAIDGIACYLDCEHSLNPEFAVRASHVDADKMLVYKPDSLENVFLKVYNIIDAVRKKYPDKPLVLVYDSIGISPSAREMREVNLPENYTKAQWKKIVGSNEQPGERAKICNREMRKLETLLEKTDTTMLVINQIRQKVGMVFGNPEYGAGGGQSLEFACSCRLRTSSQRKIENEKLGMAIGVNMKVRNIKNRCFRPFTETEGIQLYFDNGINPLSGLLSMLIQCERIEKAGQGTYQVLPPWTGNGSSVRFKSSAERNDIPASVLLECPMLIDATTSKEVEDYLAIFDSAISQTLSSSTVEKEVGEDYFGEDKDEDDED